MSDFSASSIDWHVQWHGDPQLPVLVFVHGFAGSANSFADLLPYLDDHFHMMLIDLPGHGRTPLPSERDITLAQLGSALGQLISNAAEEPANLCGYSMGGRIALHTALYAGEMVRSLALIGASPGIVDRKEREERKQSDRQLARDIREKGMEWFADYWGALPMFATQNNLAEPIKRRLREARLTNDPEGLAWALEHMSTGMQEDLHPKLFELQCPVLLLAGSQDKKFCRSNWGFEEHAKGNVQVSRVEVHGAGHAAHIEAPDIVAEELIKFFTFDNV
jgi:2-succinyl-6-hydroxy-2,4-cyclohexadiene-1-carboxylate synthase